MFPMEETDDMIIKRTLSGEDLAFSFLVDRYKSRVYTLAYKMVFHLEVAEDISQEAFMKIYRNLGNYDAKKASFSTWAYRITYNLCVDYLRKKRDEVPLNDEYPLANHCTPEEEAIKSEQVSRLHQAIDSLPEDYRVPVVLFHFQGLRYQQICDVLDVPMSIVKNRLYRARKLLRKELSGGEGNGL